MQAGADYQFAGGWVIGIEGQYSWLHRHDNNNGFVFPAGPAFGYVYYNNQRSLGSVTGRIGYARGPALLCAKGGYAYAERRDDLYFGGAPFLGAYDRGHRDGYTVGAGLEYMFARAGRSRVNTCTTTSTGTGFRPRSCSRLSATGVMTFTRSRSV